MDPKIIRRQISSIRKRLFKMHMSKLTGNDISREFQFLAEEVKRLSERLGGNGGGNVVELAEFRVSSFPKVSEWYEENIRRIKKLRTDVNQSVRNSRILTMRPPIKKKNKKKKKKKRGVMDEISFRTNAEVDGILQGVQKKNTRIEEENDESKKDQVEEFSGEELRLSRIHEVLKREMCMLLDSKLLDDRNRFSVGEVIAKCEKEIGRIRSERGRLQRKIRIHIKNERISKILEENVEDYEDEEKELLLEEKSGDVGNDLKDIYNVLDFTLKKKSDHEKVEKKEVVQEEIIVGDVEEDEELVNLAVDDELFQVNDFKDFKRILRNKTEDANKSSGMNKSVPKTKQGRNGEMSFGGGRAELEKRRRIEDEQRRREEEKKQLFAMNKQQRYEYFKQNEMNRLKNLLQSNESRTQLSTIMGTEEKKKKNSSMFPRKQKVEDIEKEVDLLESSFRNKDVLAKKSIPVLRSQKNHLPSSSRNHILQKGFENIEDEDEIVNIERISVIKNNDKPKSRNLTGNRSVMHNLSALVDKFDENLNRSELNNILDLEFQRIAEQEKSQKSRLEQKSSGHGPRNSRNGSTSTARRSGIKEVSVRNEETIPDDRDWSFVRSSKRKKRFLSNPNFRKKRKPKKRRSKRSFQSFEEPKEVEKKKKRGREVKPAVARKLAIMRNRERMKRKEEMEKSRQRIEEDRNKKLLTIKKKQKQALERNLKGQMAKKKVLSLLNSIHIEDDSKYEKEKLAREKARKLKVTKRKAMIRLRESRRKSQKQKKRDLQQEMEKEKMKWKKRDDRIRNFLEKQKMKDKISSFNTSHDFSVPNIDSDPLFIRENKRPTRKKRNKTWKRNNRKNEYKKIQDVNVSSIAIEDNYKRMIRNSLDEIPQPRRSLPVPTFKIQGDDVDL